MFCRKCGATLPADATQCMKCGTVVEMEEEVKEVVVCVSAKSRSVAMILAVVSFFLAPWGLGGLHRLYVGKYVSGGVYNFTCGCLFLGVIYDFGLLLTNSFKDQEGFPLYADSPSNRDYRRRPLKNNYTSKVILYGFLGFALFGILLGMLSGL